MCAIDLVGAAGVGSSMVWRLLGLAALGMLGVVFGG
jgi:hypothetical protein